MAVAGRDKTALAGALAEMKADGAAEVRGAEVMNETEADGAADMTALAD